MKSRVSAMPCKIVPFLAVVLLFAEAAIADNTINLQGGGASQANINTSAASSSLIDIYQVGTGSTNKVGMASPITQAGSSHTARIGQGATFASGTWTPGSAVSNNSATISQSGATGDSAAIYQRTNSNIASITQSESSQIATVNQSGSAFNSATLTQSGAAALQANITQRGTAASTLIASQAAASAYTLAVTQGGSGGHEADLATTSTYNGAGLTVNQTGSNNTANVSGMSGGSASISQSGTGDNVSLVNQSSGALTISQQGTNNGLSITNYGAGASAGRALSVTQTTVVQIWPLPPLLNITTYNPLPPPSGPTYSAQ